MIKQAQDIIFLCLFLFVEKLLSFLREISMIKVC